jgi:membrane associated rhomboid family serine protease
MLILPIGRDEAVIQRHAWVSYSIIVFNVLVFLMTNIAERPSIRAAEAQWQTTMRFYVAHPYLKVPTEIEPLVPDEVTELVRQNQAKPKSSIDKRDEQLEFDRMADDLAYKYRRIPNVRFGYIPAEGGWWHIVTSMFVHADFMHLLGNLLFFFVTGPFIEDVFGRPLFAALYFSGGLVATLGYAAKHPDSYVPLIGASGAIAAVMGAYLARFLRSKLEFIWVPFIFRPMWNFRFFVPAFVVLPLWFAEQWWASSTVESSGAGVAFSAHVFGFVYGVAAALLVKVSGFEAKYVAPVVEKQISWKADDRYTRALEERTKGGFDVAKAELTSLLAEQPSHLGGLELIVDIARETEDYRALETYGPRLLAKFMEEKNEFACQELIHDVVGTHDTRLPIPRFLARAGQYAEKIGDHEWALQMYERVCELELTGPNAVPSLVKLGNMRKAKGDLAGARVALTNARYHPECSEEWATNIERRLEALL